jgi:hypothetical protein
MALTAQDVTQLQQALNPQFEAIGKQITTLSDAVKENSANNRGSIQQLFELDRKQADEIRRIEADATEQLNKVAAAIRKENEEKIEKTRVELSAKDDKIEKASAEDLSELRTELIRRSDRNLAIIGTVIAGAAIVVPLIFK